MNNPQKNRVGFVIFINIQFYTLIFLGLNYFYVKFCQIDNRKNQELLNFEGIE